MSDPIAVSILAKLTSYWSCNGDLADAHGSNDIGSGLNGVSYEAGQSGQRLVTGARGYCTLASPIAIDGSTALTIGGRFTFGGDGSLSGCIALSDDFNTTNEAMAINVSASESTWSASSWADESNNYFAKSAAADAQYPITVRVTDTFADTLSSAQVISISTPEGITEGLSYDVYGVWEGEYLKIYINGALAATSTPPRPTPTKTQALYFQIGNQFGPAGNPCASEELILCDGAALTAAEVEWLYNSGAGRTYAGIVAAAA